MVVIRGRLTPEVGAVVQRALEAATDRLFREAKEVPKAERLAEDVTPAQRRADALGLLAEAALTSDLDRGSAGDRYQVVLHVEAPTEVAAGEGLGVAAGDGLAGRRSRSTTARWTSPRRRRDACHATRPSSAWRVRSHHSLDLGRLRCGGRLRGDVATPLHATRRLSAWRTPRTGRCSTSAGRRAPCRHLFAALSRPATIPADSRAVRPAAATRITSSTGSTAAPPAWTIWSSCADAITAPCTREDSN